jgi:hypothetical protein
MKGLELAAPVRKALAVRALQPGAFDLFIDRVTQAIPPSISSPVTPRRMDRGALSAVP